MPDLGPYHPQLVHFVVALGLVGVAFRLISLTGRLSWTGPAATVLLLLTGAASVAAVSSGVAAHGPVERVPGARDVVHEHEEKGELTRNLFLAVAALELVGLAVRRRERLARGFLVASALAGITASVVLYRAADLGGELVYSYAGGVGLRSSDAEDLHRLLVAGLYHQSRAAREAGRRDEARRLTEELVRQVPDDPAVALLLIESILRDRQDPRAALTELQALAPPDDSPRLAIQKGLLESEALAALGLPDSARTILDHLSRRFPGAERRLAEARARLP
jgi:uncharacterized membrane protein